MWNNTITVSYPLADGYFLKRKIPFLPLAESCNPENIRVYMQNIVSQKILIITFLSTSRSNLQMSTFISFLSKISDNPRNQQTCNASPPWNILLCAMLMVGVCKTLFNSILGGYYNGVKYDLDQTVPGGCSLDQN